jgi:hypothetical protein
MRGNGADASSIGKEPQMARTVKLAPTEKSELKAKQVVAPARFSGIRNNLPVIVGAVALVAAGALAGSALARGGFDGRDGRHPGRETHMRMDQDGDHRGGGMGGPRGDRDGDGPQGAGRPGTGADISGTVASSTASQVVITLADGSTQTVVLDGSSQYFKQSTATAADVTVGTHLLVDAGMPIGGSTGDAAGIAVLTDGLTDAHVHLGRPAKVTAVNGSELTLEIVTRQGTATLKVTIGATTAISKVSPATNADLTAGSAVVVDLGRGALSAKSVLIVQ